MIENKRFTLIKDTEWWFVSDNTIKVNEFGYRDDLTGEDKYRGLKQDLTEKEVVDLLNELAEENEQLKSSDTITDLETEIMKLKTIIDQLRTDNTKLKKKLNTAMKENEQLKCGNKNLKAILNDFINILNRLQSNPNNEQTLNVARDMLQNMGKELEE
jgi:regulator of replication initiation timing